MAFRSLSFNRSAAIAAHISNMAIAAEFDVLTNSKPLTVAVAQFPVLGRNERSKIGRIKIMVSPQGMILSTKDRCGELRKSGIAIAVCGAVKTYDPSSEYMPCSIEELDLYQAFTETVADHIASFRHAEFSRRGEIIVNIAEHETIKTTGIFLSTILTDVE